MVGTIKKRPIGGGEVPGAPLEVKPGGPHYPRLIRPVGGGDVPGIPIYTCGGPRWEDFEWPEGVKKPTQWPKEPTDAEIIKTGIDFIMDTNFGGE